MIQNFIAILPETFVAVSALLVLIIGAFNGDRVTNLLSIFAAFLLAIAILLIFHTGSADKIAFSGMFISNYFTYFGKILILLSAIASLILYSGHSRFDTKNRRAEVPAIILLSVVGMMFLLSAGDFLMFYLGIELQALCFYILASLSRDVRKSSEAGLKYFVLGALTSGIMLFGISLIYGFSGTINFANLEMLFGETNSAYQVATLFGIIFVIIAICFKMSLAPFHMWTPDIYEGSPTPFTVFFATTAKITIVLVAIRIFFELFSGLLGYLEQIIIFVSVSSMIIGAFAAIKQDNLKRLLAYSTIGHMGYLFMAFLSNSPEAISSALLYISLYVVANFGAFAFLMFIKQSHNLAHSSDDESLESIRVFAGLAKTRPLLSVCFSIIILSMAGIIPFAGFFGKFYVFMAVLNAGFYVVATIAVLTTVVSAFYYLRIIKIMYFDESHEVFNKQVTRAVKYVIAISALFNLLFFIFQDRYLLLLDNVAKTFFN